MVLIFPTIEELSRAAAEVFITAARRAVAERGRFSVGLSGGRAPRRLFALLASPDYAEVAPWKKTHVFWADERRVPRSSPRSNAGLAERLFLGCVGVPGPQIHEMPVALPPRRAAAAYEADLRELFDNRSRGLDLVFLGLGEDGHTASLFPRSASLLEKRKWVVPVARRSEGFGRLSLTAPFLSRSREVVFLVYGGKKPGPWRARWGTPSGRRPCRPSSSARPGGRVQWLVDRKASALLTSCELAGRGPGVRRPARRQG